MTEKEIKQARKTAPRFTGIALTEEQKQLHRELDCRNMINSCLCYWHDFLNSRYVDSYIDEIWKKRVLQLYLEQLEDFEKSEVLYDVYTDSEWCTYNAIKWYDEK